MGSIFYTVNRSRIGFIANLLDHGDRKQFIWSVDPDEFKSSHTKVIMDEFSIKYTRQEFDKILSDTRAYYCTNKGADYAVS